MPSFATSIDEAFQNYFPKSKMNATRKYEQELKDEIKKLAVASNYQSRDLYMFLSNYNVMEHHDFTKVAIARDPQLNATILEENRSFYSTLNDYLRRINSSMDSAFKQYTGKDLAQQTLIIYKREFPSLFATAKEQCKKLNKMMIAKGYDKVLASGNDANKYFVQLLEVRGTLLNWLVELNKQVDIANQMAAMFVNEIK